MSLRLRWALFKRIIPFIIHIIVMLIVASLFDKLFEMLLFFVSYSFISKCFVSQFHADTLFDDDPSKSVRWCKIITVIVEIVYLFYCKEYDISIYSNIWLIMLIAKFSALLQFLLERIIVKESKLRDEKTLLALCEEAKLTKEATNRMILRYIKKLKVREIADLECVEEKTIKESLRRSKHKLNL